MLDRICKDNVYDVLDCLEIHDIYKLLKFINIDEFDYIESRRSYEHRIDLIKGHDFNAVAYVLGCEKADDIEWSKDTHMDREKSYKWNKEFYDFLVDSYLKLDDDDDIIESPYTIDTFNVIFYYSQ